MRFQPFRVQNKMVMVYLIIKDCHDQPLKASPPSFYMWAITESPGNEGGITLMQIFSSSLLIASGLLQTDRKVHIRRSFEKTGVSEGWEMIRKGGNG